MPCESLESVASAQGESAVATAQTLAFYHAHSNGTSLIRHGTAVRGSGKAAGPNWDSVP